MRKSLIPIVFIILILLLSTILKIKKNKLKVYSSKSLLNTRALWSVAGVGDFL